MVTMKKERNEARVPSYNENDSQGTSPSEMGVGEYPLRVGWGITLREG